MSEKLWFSMLCALLCYIGDALRAGMGPSCPPAALDAIRRYEQMKTAQNDESSCGG